MLILGLISGAISFFIGGAWYSIFFKNQWLEGIEKTEKEIMESSTNPLMPMVKTFLVELFLGLVYVSLFTFAKQNNGLLIITIQVCLVATLSSFKNYFFENRKSILLLVNESYKLITVLVASLLVYFWG